MHRAGFWIRTLAAGIDLIAFFAFSIISGFLRDSGATRSANDAIASLFVCVAWLAYSTFEIWTAGTPGKLLLRLRIRAIDGSIADFWRKFLRWSTKQLPIIALSLFIVTGFVPLYWLAGFMNVVVSVGCLYALDDDHLTWHDQWAKTVVYRQRKVRPALEAAALSAPGQAPPTEGRA